MAMGKRRFGQLAVVLGGLALACEGESPIVGASDGASAAASATGGGSGGAGPLGVSTGGALAGSSGTVISGISGASPGTYTSFMERIAVGDPEVTGCLPRPLPEDAVGAACRVYRASPDGCGCTYPPLEPIPPEALDAVRASAKLHGRCGPWTGISCDEYCACEVTPAQALERDLCLSDPADPTMWQGWCYVDPDAGLGASELVADCDPTERRRLRVSVNQAGGDFYIACNDHVLAAPGEGAGALGSPCVAGPEHHPLFGSFSAQDVSVDVGGASCASGVCLINHFQGRASCPYGQTTVAAAEGDYQCFLPGSDEPVIVPVRAQQMARRAADAQTCSCRCDGPGPGPFCECPSGMECAPLIPDLRLGAEQLVGSYCINAGTAYDPLVPAESCMRSTLGGDGGSCGDPRPYPLLDP